MSEMAFGVLPRAMEEEIRRRVMGGKVKEAPRPRKLGPTNARVSYTPEELAARRELKKARKSQRQSRQASQRKARHGRKRGH